MAVDDRIMTFSFLMVVSSNVVKRKLQKCLGCVFLWSQVI